MADFDGSRGFGGDDDRERRQILDEFMSAVRKGKHPFLDEDDMIEAFDYASDLNDDYARMELLLAAERLYPSSVEMAERKAFFYYSLGLDEAARGALRALPGDSALGKMLGLILDKPDKETAKKILEEIIESTSDFEDEEVIRLVETAENLGLHSWIKERTADIRKRCSYPQSFVYEMMQYARLEGDTDSAEALTEELTMLEPFNCEFWEIMADIHINNRLDYEKGLGDLEYALAINPASPVALRLKARCLEELGRPTDEILKVIEESVKASPDDPETVQSMARLLYSRGFTSEAIETLEDFRRRNPSEPTTVECMALLCKGHLPDGAMDAVLAEPDNAMRIEHWLTVARQYAYQGEPEAAVTLLLARDSLSAVHDDEETIFEMLYRAARFRDIIDRWDRLGKSATDWRNTITDLTLLLSLMRVNDIARLKDAVPQIREYSEGTISSGEGGYGDRINRGTLVVFCSMLEESLRNGDDINPDEFDSFLQ